MGIRNEVANELKKYIVGRKNTDKVEINVLVLNRLIFALEGQEPILDKVVAEIKDWQRDIHDNKQDADKHDFVFERIFEIINEYKEAESEGV